MRNTGLLLGLFLVACGSSGIEEYQDGGAHPYTHPGELRPVAKPVRQGLGEVCNKGSDCGSGFCVDTRCCDSACTGACSACNIQDSVGHCIADATCTP